MSTTNSESKQNNFSFDTNKLSDYLADQISGFEGPLQATKFDGGQSNPTFLLQTPNQKYVLRRKPPGQVLKSAHAVDREFRVMTALANTNVPVAKTYHLCEDESVIGSMFYVMEYINGRVFWDPTLPELDNSQRNAVYLEMNRVLAELHKVKVDEVGLSDYGKPGNYYERQIGRWTKQYRASETGCITSMEKLMEWLPNNIPQDDGKVVVAHGDFRLDNMMFHQTQTKVLALVDWELSTLGHPYADLAYQCMQLRMKYDSIMPGLGGIDRQSMGIPSEQEYVAAYCKHMEISEIKGWEFYLIFSFFRFAAILQGVKKRAIGGNASNENAMGLGEMVEPLGEQAIALI
ncbi:MAG: phosphotransferase [Pseudomonadales bacterium]|nr:phosphotransferase [Pseudomonadales bacterium]